MPLQRALSPWDAALAADSARMDEPWGDPPPEWKKHGVLTRRSYADGFAKIAKMNSEWAGMPVQLPGEKMTVEKSYFAAGKQEELNRIMNSNVEIELRVCRNEDVNEETALRNTFWSDRLRGQVMIWQEGEHFTGGVAHTNRLDYDLRTLGCADAWSLETEEKALECLRSLVTHQQFRQYLLTSSFIERSNRSGVFYMFRRLRPTLALSGNSGRMRILAALCQHPIAYYQNSWAGAMCPSDDVVAHLALMRGDEAMFWKRSNQHHPSRPEAGL